MLFLFEEFALDTGRRELRRGAAPVPIEPQVFDLLSFLLEHRDRVVTKEELLAAVWKRPFVSTSAINTRMNAARAAIGDSGEQQHFIRTLPRKGFRFVAAVTEGDGVAEIAALVAEGTAPRVSSVATEANPDVGPLAQARTKPPLPAATGLTGIAVAAALLLLPLLSWNSPLMLGSDASAHRGPVLASASQLDSGKIPLIEDHVRRELSLYDTKPNSKAIAISVATRKSPIGWGVSYGAPDVNTAANEAIERCRARTSADCRLYATGSDVVWPKELLPDPLPGDVHAAPLELPLLAEDLPSKLVKRSVVQTYLSHRGHKALAVSRSDFWYVYNKASSAEAARLARERCSYVAQHSCLLISVDGFLTVQVPKMYRIVDVFLLADAQDISAEDKQRIGQIYQGQDWRALARGQTGSWYPVADQLSEAAAVKAALAECANIDRDCRIVAIGNFLVSDVNS